MDYGANKRKQYLTDIRRANTLRQIRGQQILNEEEELDKLLGKMPVKEKAATEPTTEQEVQTTEVAPADAVAPSDASEDTKAEAPKKTEIDEAASDEIEAENAATDADTSTGDAEVAPEAEAEGTEGGGEATSDESVEPEAETSIDEEVPADTPEATEAAEADPVASLPTIDDEVLKPKMLQFVDRILESDSDEDRADILLLIYRAGIKSGMEFAKPADGAKKVDDQPEAQ